MPTLLNKQIGPTGLGTMRMTWTSTPPPEPQCFTTLTTALLHGSNFWNAGELYGTPAYNSCHLLNRYFSTHPDKAGDVVLSLKGGMVPGKLVADGSEENIRRSVDECLRVLGGKKKIDIFECARQDPEREVEDTVRILGKLVEEGKIEGVGLSEVDAETIRRAHKVYPVSAVEVEFSLFTTDILHNGIASTCADLGIPIVAYSPLGWGVLAGAFTSRSEIPEGDYRLRLQKFQEGNFNTNMKLVEEVRKLAERKKAAPAQIALGWILGMSEREGMPTIIPIPGGTTLEKVRENLTAEKLDEEEMREIDAILGRNRIEGGRGMSAH